MRVLERILPQNDFKFQYQKKAKPKKHQKEKKIQYCKNI